MGALIPVWNVDRTHFLCWHNFISLESYPSILSGIDSTTGIDSITGINSTTGINSKLESTQLRNGVGIGIGIPEFQKMPKIQFRNRFHCRNHNTSSAQQIPLVRFSFVHFTLQAGYFIKLPLTNGKKQHQTLHPSGMTLLYKRDLLHSV